MINKRFSPVFLLSLMALSILSLAYVIAGGGQKPFLSMFAPQSQTASLSGVGSGPINWWKFDDGSGTTAVDSAGTANGTLSGSPLPSWVAGNIGTNALSFTTGDPTSVNIGNYAGLNGLSAATWSAWVNDSFSHNGNVISDYYPFSSPASGST